MKIITLLDIFYRVMLQSGPKVSLSDDPSRRGYAPCVSSAESFMNFHQNGSTFGFGNTQEEGHGEASSVDLVVIHEVSGNLVHQSPSSIPVSWRGPVSQVFQD